jgi:hypothetical protein
LLLKSAGRRFVDIAFVFLRVLLYLIGLKAVLQEVLYVASEIQRAELNELANLVM